MFWRLVISALVASTLARVQAAPKPSAEWPFEFRDGLIQVSVAAPQSGEPLHFLVDTGASVSVVDLRTARRLGLKRGARVSVRGVHNSMNGYWPTRLKAQLGDLSLPEECLAVDLAKLSDACNSAVDGLLGLDFFRDRIVQLDFVTKRIRLLDSTDPFPAGEILPLEIRPCGMRLPVCVEGNKQQWVRLDTGCASALQWVSSSVPSAKCERRIAVGLDRISIPQTTTRLRIGTIALESVPTGLHEREIFPGESGLLGNGLLARFSSVTIDARAGRLTLGSRLPAD